MTIDNFIDIIIEKLNNLKELSKEYNLESLIRNKIPYMKSLYQNGLKGFILILDNLLELINKKDKSNKDYDPILDKGLWYDNKTKLFKRPCEPGYYFDRKGNKQIEISQDKEIDV